MKSDLIRTLFLSLLLEQKKRKRFITDKTESEQKRSGGGDVHGPRVMVMYMVKEREKREKSW